jgi:hypothetical protein
MDSILKRLRDNLKPFHFMDDDLQKKAEQIGPEYFWELSVEGVQTQAVNFKLGLTYYLQGFLYEKFNDDDNKED